MGGKKLKELLKYAAQTVFIACVMFAITIAAVYGTTWIISELYSLIMGV